MVKVDGRAFGEACLVTGHSVAMVGVAFHKPERGNMVLSEIVLIGDLRTYGKVIAHGVRLVEVAFADSERSLLAHHVRRRAVGIELETFQVIAVESVVEIIGEVDTCFQAFEEADLQCAEVVFQGGTQLRHPAGLFLEACIEGRKRSVGVGAVGVAERQPVILALQDRDGIAGLAQRRELALP